MNAFRSLAVGAVIGCALVGLYFVFTTHPIITSAVVVPLILWLSKSIRVVGPDEVALRLWFGKPKEKILYSGLVFVPWFFNIRFRGKDKSWTLCELFRVPRSPLNFRFPASLEDLMWSKDYQKLLTDVTGFVRFPYDEPESLVQIAQANVPTEEAAFQARAKPEIMAGVRDVLAEYNHNQAIGKSNLTAIKEGVQRFVLLDDGWFAANGICGNDATSLLPGRGEVIVRVETVKPGPKLEEEMEKPVLAEYSKKASTALADADGERIFGPVRKGVDAGLSTEDATALRRDALAADSGGLTVDKSEIDVSSGGNPLQDTNFGAFLGTAGAIASQYGRAKKGRGGGGNPGGKKPSNSGSGGSGKGGSSSDDDAAAAERHFKRRGKYPNWDPLKRSPHD